MKLNPCKDVPSAKMGETVTRRLLAYTQGENSYTINYMEGKKGTSAPAHSHPHLQVVYMLEGEGVFLNGEESAVIRKGDIVQIDSNVPHTFTSINEDAQWLEFFTPVREDFLP